MTQQPQNRGGGGGGGIIVHNLFFWYNVVKTIITLITIYGEDWGMEFMALFQPHYFLVYFL